MKITFVLPMHTRFPVGGFKIVYEYANRLAERNHRVVVVHRCTPPPPPGRKQRLRETLLPWTRQGEEDSLAPWFPVRSDVSMLAVEELNAEAVPDADIVIATAWQTAEWVSRYDAKKGVKYYMIQHYEACMDQQERVDATWKLPMHKIVVAYWLLELAHAFGEASRVTRIPNSIDFSRLRLVTPIDQRPPCIGMLYHNYFDWKGTHNGLVALEIAKKQIPSLKAILFGTGKRDRDLPRWIEYVHRPSSDVLLSLYNSCSVFMQPSWTEGWGLTATEAMACGCALVTTDNGGSRDYAHDDITALVAPIKNPVALAEQLLKLLQEANRRQRIAQAGYQYIQQFTWQGAVDAMEQLLLSNN